MSDFVTAAVQENQKIAEELFNKRLAELQVADPQSIGLSLLSIAETQTYLGFSKGCGAIKIDYFDEENEPSGFSRYRFLGEFEGYKYHQIKGTVVHCYLPPTIKNWRRNLADTQAPLIITEGEFKAICGCTTGISTIGLGGVHSTTNDVEGAKQLIEPLNSLPAGKIVYICFDYDGTGTGEPKDEVRLAELKLATMLKIRGLDVRIMRLGEKGSMAKVGLDDFILSGGSLALKLAEARRFVPTKKDGHIYLLSKYAIILGDIVDTKTAMAYNAQRFNVEEANCINPFEADEKTNPVRAYLQAPDRTTLNGITFDPSYPGLITREYKLNLWRGYKTIPKSGDVTLWKEFTKLFFSDDPEMEAHFEETVATMFQKPWVQQTRLMILQSNIEGIGKSFYFETIAAIINDSPKGRPNGAFDHALVTSGKDLNADFNSQLKHRKFILFNEIGERGEKHTNHIKDLVTAPSLTINEKYARAASMPNFIQFAITTNEAYTHAIHEKGRRELVYSVTATSLLAEKLRQFFERNAKLKSWINTPEARSALLYYYMNYDIDHYDASAPAPMNTSKLRMIQAAQSDFDLYKADELANVLFIIPKLEIERFKRDYPRTKLGTAIIRAKLREAGFENMAAGDKTHSQMYFTNLDVPKELQRPIVWGNADGIRILDKQVIYDYIFTRYFGARKL